MIDLTIYGQPPSKSNSYKITTIKPRGKEPYSSLGKTPKLQKYEKNFYKQLTGRHRLALECPLTARVLVYFESERPDLDNSLKIVFDCLQKGGVIVNDRQIRKIVAERFKDAKNPRVEISLTEYLKPQEQLLFAPSDADLRAWLDDHAPDHVRSSLMQKL